MKITKWVNKNEYNIYTTIFLLFALTIAPFGMGVFFVNICGDGDKLLKSNGIGIWETYFIGVTLIVCIISLITVFND